MYNFFKGSLLAIVPVLNVDREIGYHGRIGENNVLVDLVPHLEIKNIDQISNFYFILYRYVRG